MHAFVVVAAKPGRAIPPDVFRRLGEREPDDVPFLVEDHIRWASSTGGLVIAGWQGRADILGIGSHWHLDARGLTTFTGRLWPHNRPWREGDTWAEQLAQHVRQRPAEPGCQPMDGVYVTVSVDAEGRGAITTDPLAIAMVYRSETDDLVAFASRPGLAAAVAAPAGGPPRRDVFGAGWLVFTENLIGDRTGYEGVRILPVGSVVDLDPRFGSRVRSVGQAPWSGDAGLPSDLDALVDLVHDDLSERVTSIAGLPIRRPGADITGGKDSRLILALMLEAGVADRFRFRTFGTPDMPDAAVSLELARELELDHELVEPVPIEPDVFVRRLAVHTYQTSGMVSAWDLTAGLGARSEPLVSGLYAELMRTHYSSLPPISTTSDLRLRLSDPRDLDAGSILHPDVRARYDEIRNGELYDRADAGACTPQDRLDTFFMRNRLRRWSGTMEEVGNNTRLYPLYSLLGLQAAFALGEQARRGGLLHLEVMRRARPDLARHRFADAGWPAEVLTHLGDPGAYRAAAAVAAPGTQPAWQATRLREQQAVVESFLLDEPANPLFEIVDRGALFRLLLGKGPTTPRERHQVYGALTAAVWLGRHDVPIKVGTPRDQLPRVTAPARRPGTRRLPLRDTAIGWAILVRDRALGWWQELRTTDVPAVARSRRALRPIRRQVRRIQRR